jgi:cobalt-zinc-cadmium efflux system outer membrane protein
VCVLLPGLSLANNGPITLDAAIEKTLSKNPSLKQFELKGKQLIANKDTAGLRPGLNLDMEVENFAGSGDFSSFDSAETTLALSSVIEMGDKRGSRLQLADSRISQFNLMRQIEAIDLLSNLTQVYISTLAIDEKIQLAKQSVELHKALVNTVQKRVNKGIAQEADLMRAKSSLIEEEIKLETLTSKLQINKTTLASFWGDKTLGDTDISGNLYLFNAVQSFETLFSQVESSPTIQSFASQQRLKQAEVQLAKTSSRSDISWNIGVRQFQETDDTALVAGFSIPLFSGKRNRSSYQSAQYDLDVVDIDRERTLIELHQRLFEAYSHRKQAVASEKRIRLEVIPALEQALKLTLEGYERGRYTYQDVVSSQRELISAKLTRVEKSTIALLNQSIIEQLIAKPLSDSSVAVRISG